MRSGAADAINNFVTESKHEEPNPKPAEPPSSEPAIAPEMIFPTEIENLPDPSKMN